MKGAGKPPLPDGWGKDCGGSLKVRVRRFRPRPCGNAFPVLKRTYSVVGIDFLRLRVRCAVFRTCLGSSLGRPFSGCAAGTAAVSSFSFIPFSDAASK